MNVEEVNVVVCCADDERYKTSLFATLGKIAGTQDELQIAKDSEETESFLKKSVTININNKDVQVTFIDGDITLAITAVIYLLILSMTLMLVLYFILTVQIM